ncbi:MAG: SDR family NAD(P)-dependent oxidoreductase [Planctomycetota bacterium]
MTKQLQGKPIAITGASSGIGRASAIACARAGMPIALGARRVDRLEEVKGEIESAGGRAVVVECDVTNRADNEALVRACVDEFGSVYAVLANAGFGFEARSHEVPEDRLRDIFETNFFGCMHTVQAALPSMIERGEGHVLIVSSCIGKLPVPYFGPYCATKAAQWHMASAMRMELASSGIEVSSVHPVGTKTDFFDEAKRRSKPPKGAGSSLDDHSPDFLMQRPETVANAIVNGLKRPKPEVWPSAARMVGVAMCFANMWPRLPQWFMRRGMVRKMERRIASAQAE